MSDEFVKEKDITFNKLVKYFEKNKDKVWDTWLEFDSIFGNIGKQGIAGLLKVKNKKRCYVFKLSQHVNYLMKHEYEIMHGLNELSSFCVHFCRGIGTILCNVEPRHKKRMNPFEITSKYPIKKEVLLCEYIKGQKLSDLIDNKEIDENLIYSSIKQVLMALNIAQNNKKFCSYDLHSDNIIVKDCDKDIVFLYVLDDENQFYVPTYGKYPVIIDFGFSYINNLDDCPIWTSLAHTQAGFMSDRFGFATPGKKWHQIVQCVHDEFDEALIRFNIAVPTYVPQHITNNEINTLKAHCSNIIKNPKIRIEIRHNNLSKNELIKWCSNNTINCFFYDRQHFIPHGLCAVTDQAISAGKPILVTNDATFRHIHQYLDIYPNIGIKEAITKNKEGVLKMKEEWSQTKFRNKFENILLL